MEDAMTKLPNIYGSKTQFKRGELSLRLERDPARFFWLRSSDCSFGKLILHCYSRARGVF